MLRLWAIVVMCCSISAFAAEADEDVSSPKAKLPRILEHSSLENLEVVVGDSVELQVKVAGADAMSWVTKDRVICKDDKCSFATEGWSLGVHNIVFVARNSVGSQSVTFPLRVKSKKVGRAVETLKPQLTNAGDVDSLGGDDFYIRARRGLSFVYQKDNSIQILGSLPRKIEWNERFRSSGGVLQFGKAGQEEHSLTTGSYARLGMRGTRRVVELEDGTVRLRQLREAAPEWTMVASDWLQVDGDRKADIVVRLGKHAKDKNLPIARIAALRGQARVWFKKPTIQKQAEPGLTAHEEKKADALAEMKQILVPAGTSVLIDFTTGEPPVLRLPPTTLTEKIMTATTPSYLDPISWVHASKTSRDVDETASVAVDAHILPASARPAKADEVKVQARAAMQERDAILVLELLLPIHEAKRDDFEVAMLLGRAYRQLGLYEQSYLFLQSARELKAEDPEPVYQLGLLALEFGKWRQARDWFMSVRTLGYPDQQALSYYDGYTRYQLNVPYRARELLNRSLWDETDPELAASARALLKQLDAEKSWTVVTRLSMLYDSNVLRKPASATLPSGVTGSTGAALAFDLAIGSTYLKSDSGYFGAGFDFGYVGWLPQGLKSVDTALQKLHADFGFGSDDSVALDGQIYLGSFVVGGQRADDGMGLALTTALPWLAFEPELIWDLSMWIDPMPNRNDVLDPFLWEVVVPSDRSARRLKVGLGTLLSRGEATELRGRLTMTQHAYTASLIEIENYMETTLGINYGVRYSNRVRLSVLGDMTSRVFDKAPDSRKDTLLNVRADARYFQTPFLSFDGGLGLWSQSSSRSANKYTKFLLTTGVALEL